MESNDAVRQELREPALELRAMVPDVLKGYADMARAAMVEGALSTLTKELIALAIAVTRECDGCIVSHARGAARSGATRQQVAEMAGVAIMMNGGPGTVWGPRALRCFDEALAARSS